MSRVFCKKGCAKLKVPEAEAWPQESPKRI